MTAIDLRRLRLRPGEVRQERVHVELDPVVLGGQRYEPSPATFPVDVEITQASGASVFDLRFHAHLAGPCMRCLGFAEVELDVRAREVHARCSGGGRPPLRLRRREPPRVDVRARDQIALALPEQILCRPDCAGLCPVCGKDLNVEPHDHAEVELDPRRSALEELRDRL